MQSFIGSTTECPCIYKTSGINSGVDSVGDGGGYDLHFCSAISAEKAVWF